MLPKYGSSVQILSRQKSGSMHSTVALQNTHGLYSKQSSPCQIVQRVQLDAFGGGTTGFCDIKTPPGKC